MFGIGPAEVFIVLVILFICFIPVWFTGNILAKAGFSSWFALITLIPFVNIIALWVFAFIQWPKVDKTIFA